MDDWYVSYFFSCPEKQFWKAKVFIFYKAESRPISKARTYRMVQIFSINRILSSNKSTRMDKNDYNIYVEPPWNLNCFQHANIDFLKEKMVQNLSFARHRRQDALIALETSPGRCLFLWSVLYRTFLLKAKIK